MGGGLLLRGLAKAAIKPPIATGFGSAAALASSASASSSATPTVGGTKMMVQAAAAPASSVLNKFSSSSVADGWEFAGDEERLEYAIRDHLVFGTAPSREEVEEATSDLQNALGMCVGDLEVHEVQPSRQQSPHGSEYYLKRRNECPQSPNEYPVSPTRGTVSTRDITSVHLDNPVLDWIEPQIVSHGPGNVQVRRRNEVAEAFRLLQTDPVVQGVVMSIASDKAVWEAVLSNEKVKEFRKKLVEHEGASKDKEAEEGTKTDEKPNIVDMLLDYSKNAYLQLKSMIKEVINSLISFVDKKFTHDKDSATDVVEKAMKSCFTLSVIVISIVVLKRASVA